MAVPRFLLGLLLVFATAHCVSAALDENQLAFAKFVTDYNKQYDATEFFNRFEIFKDNLDWINKHNQGNHSYTVGVNEFADLTLEEFQANYLGFRPSLSPADQSRPSEFEYDEEVVKAQPARIDWRIKGAVTGVVNQGSCGSCYCFSALHQMEGVHQMATGELFKLSYQQCLDCSSSSGNYGCQGGLMDYVFSWSIRNGGVCAAKDYQYVAKQGTCKKTCSNRAKISTYKQVKARSESDLLARVAERPISVAVQANERQWQLYKGGIFDFNCGQNLDHAITAVGYDTSVSGKPYWIVKNSWGTSWGAKGYVYMARGKNLCGISNQASYSLV